MKKVLLLLVAIMGMQLAVSAQSEMTRIEGFRDFTWGEHVDSVFRNGEQVKFLASDRDDENENDGNYYKIKNDNLLIGNVLLTDIYYVFSEEDDRLFKVLMVGRKMEVEQMEFIVDYKYGKQVNEDVIDDKILKQWVITDVTISLVDFAYNKFELELKSDWKAAAAYAKNTNVNDF